MFDKTIIHEGAKHSTHVEVKQAGLHDATRNYKEFRDDAERAAAKLEIEKFGANNNITYLRLDSVHSIDSGNTRTKLVFAVNHQVYQVEKVFDRLSIEDRHKERMLIAEAIAEAIVNELMKTRKL